MSDARRRNTLSLAVLAAVSLVCLAAAQAQQETWQSSRGGASSWGAGAKTGARQSTAGPMTGASSSWIAGKGSFESTSQPGGVWQDRFAPAVAAGNPSPKSFSAGTHPTGPAPKLAGNRPAPAAVRTNSSQAKSQGARTPGAAQPSTGPHFGAASSGRSGPFKSTPAHAAQTASRSSNGSGTGSGLGAPAGIAPASNPFAISPPSGMPGSGAQGGLGDIPH
ncbi:MAG: hypothetical protein ACLQG3_16810 [Terracidiphilus sp.]